MRVDALTPLKMVHSIRFNTTMRSPVHASSRAILLLLFMVPVCLSITSCSLDSPASRLSEAGVTAPDSWSATSQARSGVDDAWIARFKDAQLTSLVREAERNSPDMTIAAARVEQARGQYYAATASGNPSVDLTFDPSRNKRNFIGFPSFGGGANSGVQSNIFNNYDLSLPVNWEVDVFGRIRAGREAALAGVDAANYDAKAARVSLAAQVAKSWFALTESEEQLRLAKELQRSYEDTATSTRERFNSGIGENAASQLRIAETDVATTKALVVERTQQVSASSRALEQLIGRYPSGTLSGASRLASLPGRTPAGLPSELLLRRPDILSAERRYAAQGARIKEAKRALYPRFQLTGSLGTSSDQLKNLLSSDFGVWRIAANITQPIFSGGVVEAQVAIRKGADKELAAELQKTVLRAFSEVENALAAELDLAKREQSVADAERIATDALQASKTAFRDGAGDALTVLAAEARLMNAKSQLLSLRRARLDNRIMLHLALGGDYKAKNSQK